MCGGSKKCLSQNFSTALNRPFKAFSPAIIGLKAHKKSECKANYKYQCSKVFFSLIINSNKTRVAAVLIVGHTSPLQRRVPRGGSAYVCVIMMLSEGLCGK